MSAIIVVGAVWLSAAFIVATAFHVFKHPRSVWDDIV